MKPITCLLFAFMVSIALSIPIHALADPQLDSLIMIANQARDNIKISISQFETVPAEIIELYEEGSSETDALIQSAQQNDISLSRQHFISAMSLFKKASDKISSLTSVIEEQPLHADTSQLQNKIIILEKTAQKLKTIAVKNNIVIDFTEFETLMGNARQNLEEENTEEAIKALDTAKQFIIDAHKSLSFATKQKASDRAKDYLIKQIERLDNLIDQANFTLSQNTVEAMSEDEMNKTQIPNTKDMLIDLKQLVLEGKFKEAAKMIKSIEKILNNNTRAKAMIDEISNVNSTDTSSNATRNE